MVEFAYNNKVSATISITPFFALYGQHPRYIIRKKPVNIDKKPAGLPTPTALEEWANQLDQLNSYLKSEMMYAQAVQSE